MTDLSYSPYKQCTQCERLMSANDPHRRCQSCRGHSRWKGLTPEYQREWRRKNRERKADAH